MLDHMSKGRVEFGVIRGLDNRVNGNFHPQADRRNQKVNQALFWESLDIIELAWQGEPFHFEGQFYRFPMPGWIDQKTPKNELDPRFYTPEGELAHLKVMPQPYQKPMPPRWLMADTVSSHVEAARRGMGVLSFAQSFQRTKASWHAYRAARSNQGPAAGELERLGLMRPIFVAPNQADAEAVMRPALNLNMLRGVRANADLEAARRAFLADDEELTPRDLSDDWFDFLVRKEHCHVGTPDYVALRALAEKLGVKAQITPIEYPAMLPSIQAGRFQVGLGGFFDTPERRQVVLFVTNMYAVGGLLTRKDNPDKVAFDDLCGKTVSTTEGTFQAIHLDAINKECIAGGKRAVQIVLMKGTLPQVEALKAGRIGAIYLTKAVMAYMARQNATDLEDIPGVMPDPSGEKKVQGFILPKSEMQLANALQAAMNAAIADGIYARILKKWNIPEDVAVEKAMVD